MKILIRRKSILGLAATLLLALGVSAQTIPGVSTRVANGASLPAHAGQYTLFVLTTGTPTLYVCNANPCMSSGDWVASGGGGGGGGGANPALSNLSAVAINATLAAGSGETLTLSGFNGTSGAGATGVIIEGGVSYSGGSSAGPNVAIEGGTGAGSGAGGQVSIVGGPAQSGAQGGPIFLTASDATGAGAGGDIYVRAGRGLGSGAQGFLSLAGGGANYVGSVTPISGYVAGVYFNLGTGAVPAEIDFASGASANGLVRMTAMNFAWSPDNTNDFDLAAYRPRDAYFGRSVYAEYYVAAGSTAPVAQNSLAWNAQGLYAGTPTSQAGQMTMSFATGGVVETSFNGGGINQIAYLTSSISGNAGTATAFAGTPTNCGNSYSSGIGANGNAICPTPTIGTLPTQSGGTVAASGYGNWGFTSAGFWYSVNGGSVTFVGAGASNVFTQDSTGSDPSDTAEVINEGGLTNSQTLRVYHTFASSTNFSRLQFAWDTTNAAWQIGSQGGSGGGTAGNIEFATGSTPSPRWMIESSDTFALTPIGSDNTYDIGCVAGGHSPCGVSSPFRVHDLYLGTAISLNAGFGTAGNCLLSGGGGAADTWGSCTGGFTYPSAGIVTSTGSAFSNIAETNNYVLVGVGGAWTAAAITGAMLPNPSASTLGGVESITSAAHNWVSYIDTSGVPHQSQPTLADVAAGAAPAGTFDFTSATPKVPTASAGNNSTNAASTAYVPAEMNALTWSCPISGFTSTVSSCNWTLPAGITITGFDLYAGTAATSCGTYPVLSIYDSTATAIVGSYSITMTSATNGYTQLTGSTGVASAHVLRIKTTTAGSGCTGPANVVATVTYQMTN